MVILTIEAAGLPVVTTDRCKTGLEVLDVERIRGYTVENIARTHEEIFYS